MQRQDILELPDIAYESALLQTLLYYKSSDFGFRKISERCLCVLRTPELLTYPTYQPQGGTFFAKKP